MVFKKIYMMVFNSFKKKRYEFVKQWLITKGKAIDVGAGDTVFIDIMKELGLDAIGLDIKPKSSKIMKGSIENLKFKDKSFDVVVCFETLEHTFNPVKAINELKRICKKQLIISVPNEPWFSLFRLGWFKGHMWARSPTILKHYLGSPYREKVFLKRYYFAEWRFK